ncbi:MAG: class I SAM-dependent methyltransferase [Betaproteobacteria bacterium]|nr:class I SAM-dependent methyltransferase [Betaproteobacteria bacterium]
MKDNLQLIERFMDYLINPTDCIDTYGRRYVDDLENIVIENHDFDVNTQQFADPQAQKWFELICSHFQFVSLEDMIAYVKAHERELDLANIRPRSTFHGETLYNSEPSFHTLKNESNSIDLNNEFQLKWSLRAIGDVPENEIYADSYELYMGSDRTNPWTYLVRREIMRGNIALEDPVICIGNRWLGEILYFRQNLGLRNTKGVDLVSSNPELVISADMHHLPFEDNSIKLIFARGVINKSYDVRLLAKEWLRVLRKDGFLIVETPGPYGYGVTRLGQTDIKSSKNLLRLFRGKIRRLIYCAEEKPYRIAYDVTNLIRIFIQVDKDGWGNTVKVEPFSRIRFRIYEFWRRYFLRARRKLHLIGILPART